MKPLKEMSLEELKKNYITLCKWVIKRENAQTSSGKKEWDAGIRRIEDYERELIERGMDLQEISNLYSTAVLDGNVPDETY